jgi:hypothetical protein
MTRSTVTQRSAKNAIACPNNATHVTPFFVVENLEVRQPADVVDREVRALPPRLAGPAIAMLAARDPTWSFEPPSCLTSIMDQLRDGDGNTGSAAPAARAATAVAGPDGPAPHTPVEGSTPSSAAILVRRSWSNASVAAVRSSRRSCRQCDSRPDAVPMTRSVIGSPARHRASDNRCVPNSRPLPRFLDGPTLFVHALAHQLTHERCQLGVTVQFHGSPWGEGDFSTPESQGDPTDERGWDLQTPTPTASTGSSACWGPAIRALCRSRDARSAGSSRRASTRGR